MPGFRGGKAALVSVRADDCTAEGAVLAQDQKIYEQLANLLQFPFS
jgi:hypothetical protein